MGGASLTKETGTQNAADDRPEVPLKVQSAVYATGAFASSTDHMINIILPLWAVAIGASPFMIGIIIGARHFLTAFLSIHGGAMMDRIGTRRVLIVLGVIATVAPLLFPVLPFIWAAIVLQMIIGLATNYGWMGAQAQIGNIMKGNPFYAGRLTFSLRLGQLVAPPLAGFAWDTGGAWAAFAVLSAWGAGLLTSSYLLPRGEFDPEPGAVKFSDVMPRLSDYVDAFRLLVIPTVVLVVLVSVLRMAGIGMQASFYVIYLQQLGYAGTVIGLLISAGSILGFAGALSVSPLTRLFSRNSLLLASIGASVLFVAITPLIASIFAFLLIASALRGGAMGLSQPLMISILGNAAGPGNQGKAVGLRTTANRVTSMIIPVIMGTIVEFAGIETSFLVVGPVLIVLVIALAMIMGRRAGQQNEG